MITPITNNLRSSHSMNISPIKVPRSNVSFEGAGVGAKTTAKVFEPIKDFFTKTVRDFVVDKAIPFIKDIPNKANKVINWVKEKGAKAFQTVKDFVTKHKKASIATAASVGAVATGAVVAGGVKHAKNKE